jgi:hypothetical protein
MGVLISTVLDVAVLRTLTTLNALRQQALLGRAHQGVELILNLALIGSRVLCVGIACNLIRKGVVRGKRVPRALNHPRS